MTCPEGQACKCRDNEDKRSVICIDNAEILENVQLANDTFRIRFTCGEMAKHFMPGQFAMLRLPGSHDPLLGRPLAIYDVSPPDANGEAWADIVYLVVGKGTTLLSKMQPGQTLEAWGPLGQPFPAVDCDHLIFVAGGIGQTPFLSMAKQYRGLAVYGAPPMEVPAPKKISLCYGARNKEWLAGVEDFLATGIDIFLSTDDGSMGHAGFVTDLIEPIVDPSQRTHILCCGPEPMLAAAAAVAKKLELPCHASLETPMACGMGICFSCVTKVRQDDGTFDYKRVCVDGPVFDAHRLDL